MTSFALAVPLDDEQRLVSEAARFGHSVVLRCSGADELAGRIGGTGVEAALVVADPQYLSPRVIEVCDSAAVRLLVVAQHPEHLKFARSLGIADARGDAHPADKHAAIAGLQEGGAVVAMVGDGINDAPSLAQAQVSVSLGSATPLAQWTADIVVLSDELPRIADAIVHARRTFRIVRENLAWALAYNLVAIPAAAFGYLTPLVAAFGMSMSSLIVVGNSLRAARVRRAGATEGPA